MLVGVAGSGKQSLARLAAFAAKQQVFEVTLSRGYGEANFREDLKRIYQLLGPDGQKVSKVLSESKLPPCVDIAQLVLRFVCGLSVQKEWPAGIGLQAQRHAALLGPA